MYLLLVLNLLITLWSFGPRSGYRGIAYGLLTVGPEDPNPPLHVCFWPSRSDILSIAGVDLELVQESLYTSRAPPEYWAGWFLPYRWALST